MADSYLERVAGEIADLAIADEVASGDINVIDQIAKVLGSSSQTLEEAFLTAVRVRKAEARARELLERRKAAGYADVEKPDTTQIVSDVQAIDDTSQDDTPPDTPTAEPAAEETDDTEDTLEKLKRAGIGAPRRVQR